MPIYEFTCRECQHNYDDLVGADDLDAQRCPHCSSADVVRVYAPFAVHSSTSSTSTADVACGQGACMPGPASAGGGGGCCGGGCGGCG